MGKGNKAQDNFTQVCVMPRTILGKNTPEQFVDFIKEEFGCRAKFIEELKIDESKGVGDRTDLLFYIHSDDIGKFAVSRLSYGIRWLEDVYGNGQGDIYPERISALRTW